MTKTKPFGPSVFLRQAKAAKSSAGQRVEREARKLAAKKELERQACPWGQGCGITRVFVPTVMGNLPRFFFGGPVFGKPFSLYRIGGHVPRPLIWEVRGPLGFRGRNGTGSYLQSIR